MKNRIELKNVLVESNRKHKHMKGIIGKLENMSFEITEFVEQKIKKKKERRKVNSLRN